LVRGEDIGVPTFNKVEDMSNQPVQTDESLKNTKETVRNKVPDILPTT